MHEKLGNSPVITLVCHDLGVFSSLVTVIPTNWNPITATQRLADDDEGARVTAREVACHDNFQLVEKFIVWKKVSELPALMIYL